VKRGPDSESMVFSSEADRNKEREPQLAKAG
jgi:hypothetical protein